MNKIVHIVFRDKFTAGYFEFMKNTFTNYDHVFFTLDNREKLKFTDDIEVNYFLRAREIFVERNDYVGELEKASKIIISGVFYKVFFVFLVLKPSLLRKTYFHFWGGDFYHLRKERILSKLLLLIIRNTCFKNCAGLVFLIDGEYEKFQSITHIQNRAFVAPMLGGDAQLDYSKYYVKKHSNHNCKIIVGNSATKTNRHKEAFECLKACLNGNFSIICPLSYGDEEYGNRIEKLGYQLFGNRFFPIRKYMEKSDYIQLLADCDIGIFNNDRQQAMGNINILLRLGKTVYIRQDTVMWNKYISDGYYVKAIEDIPTAGLTYISEEQARSNQNPDKRKNERARGILQWKRVLEDER